MTDDEPFECDCCGAIVPEYQLRTVIAYGIETSACETCRGVSERCVTTRQLSVHEAAKICPVFRFLTGAE